MFYTHERITFTHIYVYIYIHTHKYVCVCVCVCVCVYLCTECVPGAHGGQKHVLDPPELELQKAVSNHVGARNLTQVLWQSSWCS